MELDVVLLSRLQFAFTVMFHYLFPPLAIGVGWIMVVYEGLYLKTGDQVYEDIARFLTKIFAVNFALGVASGIVMEFEFGTNWATYSRYVGDVFGSALAAEGIFAFFLESGFLAVLVFGWDRVSKKMHFFSTLMVALGSTFSAVWIVVANSWQQTPTGYHIVGEGTAARAEILDFWAVVFNPSTVDRLVHTTVGALVLGAFFVMSIAAYYILRERHLHHAKKMFSVALVFGVVASLLAPLTGHSSAMVVAKQQPAKLAAFEGMFTTPEGGAPLSLIGWPDADAETTHFEIGVPGLLSFLVHGDFSTPVPGLDTVPRSDWPPVLLSYMAYHIMVGLGMAFVALMLLAVYFRWKGKLFETRWLMWVFVFAVIGPFISNELGWVAAEVGRQPWIVYGLLRTSDAVSVAVAGPEVAASMVMFGVIYALLFLVWLYVLDSKIKHGIDSAVPVEAGDAGVIETASRRADPGGASLTSARDDGQEVE